jgi:hypothetical protein
MRAATIGFGLTTAAVATLLGSLVLGLRAPAGEATPEAPQPVAANAPPHPPRERIRVEVLNAAGIAGLAREVTTTLRGQGFDVVYYGNAGRREARDSTTILDRAGDAEAAQAVAAALRIPRIEQAIDTTLYLEATVILAPDFASLRRGEAF